MKNQLVLFICLVSSGTGSRLYAQLYAGSYDNTGGGTIETVDIFTFPPPFGMPANEAEATLDLNHDGQPDLRFVCQSDAAVDASGGGTGLTTLHAGAACMVDGDHFVRRLPFGQPIDGSQAWEAVNSPLAVDVGLFGGAYTAGNWLSVPEGYAGVRLVEGSDTLYAWLYILAYVAPSGAATLKVQTWALEAPHTGKPPAPFIIAGSVAGLVPGNKQIGMHLEDVPSGNAAAKQDSLDLNEDGIFDVAFRLSLCSMPPDCAGSSSGCIALHEGFTFTILQGDPERFSAGDSIPAAGPWNLSALPQRSGLFSSDGTGVNGPQNTGAWLGASWGYLGFRLVTPGSDTLLGWMHVFTYTLNTSAAHLDADAWAIEHDPQQAPFAQISVTPQKAVYCAGDTATFHAETLDAQSIVWEFWDGTTDTARTVSRVLPDASVHVYLQATNLYGSTDIASHFDISPLTLTLQHETISCFQPLAVLNVQTSIPAAISWITGTDTIFSPQVPLIDFAGPVGVIATDVNGCVATGQLIVWQGPVSPQVQLLYEEETGLLTAYSGTPGVAYSWAGPGWPEPVSGVSVSAGLSGTYTVTATDPNGCTAVASIDLVVLSSGAPDPQDITISPNPVDDVLNLENGAGRTLHVRILDLTGREVLSPGPVAAGMRASFDVGVLAGGFYWLSAREPEGRAEVWIKLVKR